MSTGSGWEQPGRRRVRPLAAGLAAVLVAGGLVVAVVSAADRGGGLAVEEGDSPPPQPGGEDGEDLRPPQPVGEDARRTPFPRPSGYGAAPAPAAGEGWRRLPDAPIDARLEPLSAWTGEEFVVWGGTVHDDTTAEGAAYAPDRDAWRRLPDAPAAMSAATAATAWTGEEVVVWGGTGDRTVAAAYDPEADRWRTLPDAPIEPDGRPPTVAWTGREVLVWAAEGAAYDPARDRWRALPAARIEGSGTDGAHLGVWAADPECEGCGSLFVWFAPADPDDGAWPGAAYDPVTDRSEEVAPADLPLGGAGLTATWVGDAVVLCCSLGGEAALAVYDPAADSWHVPIEGPVARRSLHTAVWTGDELLVWGGRQDRDRWLRGNGVTWEPHTRRWRWLAEASPRMPRQLHAAAWTGRELLVWGGYDGREPRGDGAALDPAL